MRGFLYIVSLYVRGWCAILVVDLTVCRRNEECTCVEVESRGMLHVIEFRGGGFMIQNRTTKEI
jgi:hypothetical protein